MKVLIQQVTITDPLSPFQGKKQDILIESGIIKDIQASISATADQVEVVSGKTCMYPRVG